MRIIGLFCTGDIPASPANHAVGAVSLRIYANIATRPQADRVCVLVDPKLDGQPNTLASGLTLMSQPPSQAHWLTLINRYQSILYCPIDIPGLTPWRELSQTHCPERQQSPRTRLRTLACGSLLQAMAISQVVMNSPLPLDVVLPKCAPHRWQRYQWQPGFWPTRWQLQTHTTQRTVSWPQLYQQLNGLSGITWVQLQSGDLGTLAHVWPKQKPQAGQLLLVQPQQCSERPTFN